MGILACASDLFVVFAAVPTEFADSFDDTDADARSDLLLDGSGEYAQRDAGAKSRSVHRTGLIGDWVGGLVGHWAMQIQQQ